MRQKKRYILMKSFPQNLPEGSKFLFQNQWGFVFKADLKATESLRKDAVLISGSVRKLKEPQVLNRRRAKSSTG